MIYRKLNTGIIGTPKWGKKPLNFFTFYNSEINFNDEDLNPSGKSLVAFRFHSSKAFCEMSFNEHVKQHGGIHVRIFVYDGIDKTESELIEWALTTDQFANDGATKIFGATEI